MLTEEELAAAEQASRVYRHKPESQEAASIVQDFSQNTDLTEFISLLEELFPGNAPNV